MTVTTQIETCRVHPLSFVAVPGESLMVLTLRYTAWREAHQACVLDEADNAPAEPVKIRRPRRKRAGVEG